MKFFVTGATGHIGTGLVTILKTLGHQVTALVRPNSNTSQLPEVDIIRADLLDNQSYEKQLRDSVVVHLAADVTIGRPDKQERRNMFSVNVMGTKILYDAFTKNKGKHFIYVSTRQVLDGSTEGSPMKNEMPSYYARTKSLAHIFLRSNYFDVSPVTVIIPGMIYSDLNFKTGVNFVFDYYLNHAKFTFGKDYLNTYTSLNDFCISVLKIAEKGVRGEFIIANGTLSQGELFQIFAEVSENRNLPRNLPKPIVAIAAEMFSFLSGVTGKKYLLSKEIYNNAIQDCVLDNKKSIVELGMRYSPLKDSLISALEGLLDRGVRYEKEQKKMTRLRNNCLII